MTDSARWMVIGGVVVLLVLIHLLSPVLMPFIVSAILAYLGDPMVVKLQSYRIPRTLAVIVVFIILFLVLFGLLLAVVPLLQSQIALLVAKIPDIIDWFRQTLLPWLDQRLGMVLQIDDFTHIMTQYWETVGKVAKGIVGVLTRSGAAVFSVVTSLLLIPFVTFYFLKDWHNVLGEVRKLFPRRYEAIWIKLLNDCDEVLSAFFRGQLVVMFALGVIYTLGLSMMGLELALLVGFLSGMMCIVPYLGFTVGILAAGVAAFVQFHDGWHLLYVLMVYGVGQAIESMLLTPLLVGDRIGLHPIAVIFAILSGGELFGFVGILLALPVAAVIMVLLRYLSQRYVSSELYMK